MHCSSVDLFILCSRNHASAYLLVYCSWVALPAGNMITQWSYSCRVRLWICQGYTVNCVEILLNAEFLLSICYEEHNKSSKISKIHWSCKTWYKECRSLSVRRPSISNIVGEVTRNSAEQSPWAHNTAGLTFTHLSVHKLNLVSTSTYAIQCNCYWFLYF